MTGKSPAILNLHCYRDELMFSSACKGTASKVVLHPFFWCPESRMEFFRHLSDRARQLKAEDPNFDFLTALEDKCQLICGGKWKDRMDYILVKNLRVNLKKDSMVDFLPAIRNMWAHRYQLPRDV